MEHALPDSRFRLSRDGLDASDAAGKPLRVSRSDKQTWTIQGQGEIRVEYSDYWDEPGPFGTQLNGEHAFLNLAMVLCYIPDRRAEESVVHFSDVPQSWRTAVELPAAEGARGIARRATTRWWTRPSKSGRWICSSFRPPENRSGWRFTGTRWIMRA